MSRLERDLGPAEPARGVDARREPEADRAFIDDGRSTRADRMSARRPGRCVRASCFRPGDRERAVLVDERDDVGDGRQRDEVEVPLERIVRAEQRLEELEHDAGAAELRKRVRRRPRRDDRAVGQLVSGPVVVGDDDLQPEAPGGGDLLDGGDAAVDGEHEPVAVLGELLEGLAREPVALLETARQMPADVGAELPQAVTASTVAQMPSTS